MRKTTVGRGIRLDADCDAVLRRLAADYDGNISLTVRRCIRLVAALKAQPDAHMESDEKAEEVCHG